MDGIILPLHLTSIRVSLALFLGTLFGAETMTTTNVVRADISMVLWTSGSIQPLQPPFNIAPEPMQIGRIGEFL